MASQIPHGKTHDSDLMFMKLQVADLEQAATFYGSAERCLFLRNFTTSRWRPRMN